jgi:hypothetical protein
MRPLLGVREGEIRSHRQNRRTDIHHLLAEGVVQAITQDDPDKRVIDRTDSPVAPAHGFFSNCEGWPKGHKSE